MGIKGYIDFIKENLDNDKKKSTPLKEISGGDFGNIKLGREIKRPLKSAREYKRGTVVVTRIIRRNIETGEVYQDYISKLSIIIGSSTNGFYNDGVEFVPIISYGDNGSGIPDDMHGKYFHPSDKIISGEGSRIEEREITSVYAPTDKSKQMVMDSKAGKLKSSKVRAIEAADNGNKKDFEDILGKGSWERYREAIDGKIKYWKSSGSHYGSKDLKIAKIDTIENLFNNKQN